MKRSSLFCQSSAANLRDSTGRKKYLFLTPVISVCVLEHERTRHIIVLDSCGNCDDVSSNCQYVFAPRSQWYKTLSNHLFKATGFDPGRNFHPSLMFAGNARSLPRVERLKSAQLGQAQTLAWTGKDCQEQRL